MWKASTPDERGARVHKASFIKTMVGVRAEPDGWCCWRFQNWVIHDSGAARSVHGLRRDVARRGAGAEPDDPCCWRVQNRMMRVSGATRTV